MIAMEALRGAGVDLNSHLVADYTEDELKTMGDAFLANHARYGLGVPLTRAVHKEFHARYGQITTPEQFEEFRANFDPAALAEVLKQDERRRRWNRRYLQKKHRDQQAYSVKRRLDYYLDPDLNRAEGLIQLPLFEL
jgi:hypothetical protein